MSAKMRARSKVIADAESAIAEFGHDPALMLGILDEQWHGVRYDTI